MTPSDEYLSLLLSTAGKEEAPEILKILRDSKIADQCYAYKIRTKPDKKIIEKKQRKRKEKPEYEIKNITDVVGIRLVALFKKDMIDILDSLLNTLAHTVNVKPNPFKQGAPEEVIVYIGNSAFDDVGPNVASVVQNHFKDTEVKIEKSKEGYTSIHIVARLNNTSQLNEHIPNYHLPVEIQIRTVFEDAWGEIDHKFGYVFRAGKDQGKPVHNADNVMSHLKVLKRFTDACMEYAECIRDEATAAKDGEISAANVISVESDQDLLKEFENLGVTRDLIDKYISARTAKENATKAFKSKRGEGEALYISSADEFRALADRLSNGRNFEEFSHGERLINYYIRMNEAICLMAVNGRDYAQAALNIYKSLDSQYTNYPLLKMRLGQALGRLGHYDESILKLKESGQLAETILSQITGSEGTAWPHDMPRLDYEHLQRTQPKLVGFYIWKKIAASTEMPPEERATLYLEAHAITEKLLSINIPEGDAIAEKKSNIVYHAHNNLLYYAVQVFECIKEGASLNQKETELLSIKIRKSLTYLEKAKSKLEEHDLRTLETIMRSYIHHLDLDKARVTAALIKSRCLEPHEGDDLSFESRLSFLKTCEDILKMN